MAVVVPTKGAHGQKAFPLGDRCFLGRNPECDLHELLADVAGVSRLHARIERVGGQYVIQDEGSRNGTWVNGERLAAKKLLTSGDRISIGELDLTFYDDSPAPETPDIALDEGESLARMPVAPPEPAVAGYSGEKLAALVQMLKRLGNSLDVATTLHELLSGLFAIFRQADRGFVAFTATDDMPIRLHTILFRYPEQQKSLALSPTLINHVLARREAVLWTEQGKAPGLPVTRTLDNMEVRWLMCAPLLDLEGRPFGVVQIDSNVPRLAFTKEDLEVMVGAVSQAAIAVRYAKLHEEGLKRQALEQDLRLAREVQLALLPAECAAFDRYQLFAHYQTAHEVGGDYFDFVELPGGRLAIVLADVAGKGVSAALLMAKLSGELRYYLSCAAPQWAVARLNDSLCQNGAGRFVTLVVAIVEKDSPRLTLINAGHPAPLRRRRSGAVEAVGADLRGPALGILPGKEWSQLETAIEPGDVWFVFTDGFTEAMDAAGELYGVARLEQQLARGPAAVRGAGEHILDGVRGFVGAQPQSDDMCLVGWARPEGEAAAEDHELGAKDGLTRDPDGQPVHPPGLDRQA
jgi:serine phosphatase RsbU (regulator of sigma subunit)/pSer/pThr/pTyr-binding forkhead associated (FHA) protein